MAGFIRRQDFSRDDQGVRILPEFHLVDCLEIRIRGAGEILHAAVFVDDVQIVLISTRSSREVSADHVAQIVFDRLLLMVEESASQQSQQRLRGSVFRYDARLRKLYGLIVLCDDRIHWTAPCPSRAPQTFPKKHFLRHASRIRVLHPTAEAFRFRASSQPVRQGYALPVLVHIRKSYTRIRRIETEPVSVYMHYTGKTLRLPCHQS